MKCVANVKVFAILTAISLACFTGAGDGPGSFDLSWHTIDCGGGVSSGGSFEVVGTIGQHDAGSMSGGDFSLTGGFWSAADVVPMPTCLGDLNSDGSVNVSDLLMLLSQWGFCATTGQCSADLNSDEAVNVSDMLMLLGAWGTCED